MVQQKTDNFWQAEAGSEETKKFIRDIKRLTCRKVTCPEYFSPIRGVHTLICLAI